MLAIVAALALFHQARVDGANAVAHDEALCARWCVLGYGMPRTEPSHDVLQRAAERVIGARTSGRDGRVAAHVLLCRLGIDCQSNADAAAIELSDPPMGQRFTFELPDAAYALATYYERDLSAAGLNALVNGSLRALPHYARARVRLTPLHARTTAAMDALAATDPDARWLVRDAVADGDAPDIATWLGRLARHYTGPTRVEAERLAAVLAARRRR